LAAAATLLLAPAVGLAEQSQLQFRRPDVGGKPAAKSNAPTVQFRTVRIAVPPTDSSAKPDVARRAPASSAVAPAQPAKVAVRPAAPSYVRDTQDAVVQAEFQQPGKPLHAAPRSAAGRAPASSPSRVVTTSAADARQASSVQRVSKPQLGPVAGDASMFGTIEQAGYFEGDSCVGDPACGICDSCCAEPVCGCAEPACGCEEPACGCEEPACGCDGEATCGCAEPSCGCVECGSCVGNPGPDYWCFPVCLPRIKELAFWAGPHGFKGPRDYIDGGPGDGNFGFQEGFNVGGRAPLIGFILPQLSYQAGYQAAQSRLSGTSGVDEDREQHFVTAGVFRRVRAGLQGGIVWDYVRDDLRLDEDFQQLRYEASLKSRAGREIGFWGASSLNSKEIGATTFETVDQYLGFARINFREGASMRIFGGATGDSEGLVGADFNCPLNTRWSVQGGFNYLIPDAPEGVEGAREESWNVAFNLVWHWGATAKSTNLNPYAPLFPMADNGWMFVDQVH
jgi:hypothetical protein